MSLYEKIVSFLDVSRIDVEARADHLSRIMLANSKVILVLSGCL